MKGYARSYKFRPCSVPDCPDPMGGNRKKPWLMPRRMSLSKFGEGLHGVACSTCFARINKRFNRGARLFTLKPIMGPCFETAACLQMHDRKRFLAMSLPVLNLPFTLDDLRGRAWTAAVLASHRSFELEEIAS